MIRTQISLTEEQMRRLRREAHLSRKSIAQLLREAVDLTYPVSEWEERITRIKAIAGKYEGPGDLAENHDEYYVHAYEERVGLRPPDSE